MADKPEFVDLDFGPTRQNWRARSSKRRPSPRWRKRDVSQPLAARSHGAVAAGQSDAMEDEAEAWKFKDWV